MTTPTPRTDAQAYKGDYDKFLCDRPELVAASFARQLERELTAAIRELTEKLHDYEISVPFATIHSLQEELAAKCKALENEEARSRTLVNAAVVATERAEAAEQRLATVGAALTELVTLKNLKDQIEAADLSTYSVADAEAAQLLADDYAARKPIAWEAARRALKSTAGAPSGIGVDETQAKQASPSAVDPTDSEGWSKDPNHWANRSADVHWLHFGSKDDPRRCEVCGCDLLGLTAATALHIPTDAEAIEAEQLSEASAVPVDPDEALRLEGMEWCAAELHRKGERNRALAETEAGTVGFSVQASFAAAYIEAAVFIRAEIARRKA